MTIIIEIPYTQLKIIIRPMFNKVLFITPTKQPATLTIEETKILINTIKKYI